MSRLEEETSPLAPARTDTPLGGLEGARARSERDDQDDALKRSTIMMVDDEPTTLEVLELFLRGEGYENFVVTSDSTGALELLRREKPDVLISDLIMPGVTGLELLGAIRRDPELRHVPVLILTSSTEAETKLRALELGATDFLAKPVDPSELALRLRNTLAAKAYHDYLVYYDALTGLPNRRLFVERLGRLLRSPEADVREGAVLRINLDRFKQINDALGHRVGDELLRSVAERLQRCIRSGDVVGTPGSRPETGPLSRGGGAEFLVFLHGVVPAEQGARTARRVLAGLAEPFRSEGRDIFVTASVGIALFSNDGSDIEMLMGDAGIALEKAKNGGGNNYRFFTSSLKAGSLERFSLENDLRKALDREELMIHYQPKVDVATGRIVGAEALLRWNHPELGLVPPDKFIPIAEETGVIVPIGAWVIKTVCRQIQRWQVSGFGPIPVSVNVSIIQFRTDELPGLIRSALERSSLEGRHLVLEVTESLLIEDPERTIHMLRKINQMGVRISVDDFGTGYSWLSYLKKLPLDELKIDRSFVSGVPGDGDDAALVRTVIAMAHSLGLVVVAEGVEKREQLAFLEELGCDEYQGYFFSRPAPPRDWPALFERDRSPDRGSRLSRPAVAGSPRRS